MRAEPDRERLRRARDRLSEWNLTVRDQAYADLFEGSNPVLDESELQHIDRLDSG